MRQTDSFGTGELGVPQGIAHTTVQVGVGPPSGDVRAKVQRAIGHPVQRAWPKWWLKITISVHAVLVFAQAVMAGQYLAGDYGFLEQHSVNAMVIGVVCAGTVGAAYFDRRFNAATVWPLVAAVLLFLADIGQMAAGVWRSMALHVPLGVAVTVAVVFQLVWVWRKPAAA
ncbi:hypothetical protein [Actinokineospora spheciospongiae]|uniref:hypothetical protein n=1 Tax=Actinokineospora spheciospongiae TaxID=909613 RepID=UPI000D70A635|nr:hypothetical protein [Actinokineospora spheciospongiae]PWW64434.1 hypothetical protein DFQ13_103408 [Actinokineospora spheciospongiae]